MYCIMMIKWIPLTDADNHMHDDKVVFLALIMQTITPKKKGFKGDKLSWQPFLVPLYPRVESMPIIVLLAFIEQIY